MSENTWQTQCFNSTVLGCSAGDAKNKQETEEKLCKSAAGSDRENSE